VIPYAYFHFFQNKGSRLKNERSPSIDAVTRPIKKLPPNFKKPEGHCHVDWFLYASCRILFVTSNPIPLKFIPLLFSHIRIGPFPD
jgi:hypothetical protein